MEVCPPHRAVEPVPTMMEMHVAPDVHMTFASSVFGFLPPNRSDVKFHGGLEYGRQLHVF